LSAPEGSPRITPFLWFDSNAEEALDFYLSVLGMKKLGIAELKRAAQT
jgi:predicted 3-demethylubiquinone-9 3-methyltransferase (glyoxalase superfamily)